MCVTIKGTIWTFSTVSLGEFKEVENQGGIIMRYIAKKFIAGLALLVVSAVVTASGVSLMSTAAFAGCVTKYRTECAKTDAEGRCKKYIRVSYEVCTDEKSGAHVSPRKDECFECFEWNKDGSCRKTKKVSCD